MFHFLASESVPWSCARVLSLASHGLSLEATRLAVAVVRTMRRDWARGGAAATPTATPTNAKDEDWLVHPVDPVGTLFDTLAKAHQEQGKRSFSGLVHQFNPVFWLYPGLYTNFS
jgi:hypothetical protein